MYLNAPIQIVVEDDEFNAPEAKKISGTIIVKVPRDCSFETFFQQLADQHPDVINRVLTLYYFGRNGLKTTIINGDSIAEFWCHQRRITNGSCVLTLNAMVLRHPEKNCDGCAGGLFGQFYACSPCGFLLCTSCVDDNDNGCPAHGAELLNGQLVPIPRDILDQKNREYLHEQRQHERYLERRRARALAIISSDINNNYL